MFTAKIKDIKKDVLQATGVPFLDVEVEILNGEEVIDTRKFAYPIDTPQENIVADIEKMLALHEEEMKAKEASKVADELSAKADATIAELKDSEITAA